MYYSVNSNCVRELLEVNRYLLMALAAGLAVQVKSRRPLASPDIFKNFQKRFFNLLDFELRSSAVKGLPFQAVENKNKRDMTAFLQ